jgi:hypothetical protein
MLDRRKFLATATALGTSLASLSPGASAGRSRKAPVARPRFGINLAGPSDFGTELPFVDVARLARDWISQREGAGWAGGPPLALDADGWVKRLEPGCSADTLVLTDIGSHAPPGIYTVLYKGTGKLEFVGSDARPVKTAPGRIELRVPPTSGFTVRLAETDPNNYLRELRIIRPGHEHSYRDNPWDPAFLARWNGVAALRFTSFQNTGGSKLQRWSDRPRVESATFATMGIPVELMVDLANRLGADPWFSMPHQADDDFVQQFASLVQRHLDPARSIWLEYSNEVWNEIFDEHHYAAEQGKRLGLALRPWEAANAYTALRSSEIFRIWEKVFGGSQRLVRVLPSQAANSGVSEQIAAFRGAGDRADALAIAPYVHLMVGPHSKPTASEVAGWNLNTLFDHLEKTALAETVSWIRANKAVADRYGLRLVAYEGGQHLAAYEGAENNEALSRLFLEANAHPRMGELYRSYYRAWAEAGGDVFFHFDSVSRWGKFGSWGLLQYHDDSPKTSPKYVASIEWARSLGQPMKIPA